jgi:NADP-reducing hydrogenase subunit HndB
MARLKSFDDLTRLRDAVRSRIRARHQTGTVIAIGMGTCGIAAGARQTLEALQKELADRQIDVELTSVGCIGMCAREPLVEIRQAGVSRVLYGNISADLVPKLVDEHLVNGRPVKQWIVGRMQPDN